MIKNLTIQNFAIIDHVEIEFSNGMSVLTGETGAGKSIIIDAISLLMGERATTAMVKTGQKKAFIEGTFEIENNKLKDKLEELGFDTEDQLVISREISADGKSQARVNYRLVTLSLLKEISSFIADIHSQFETQYLLNDKIHLSLLDQYIGDEMLLLQADYQSLYKEYIKEKKHYEELLNADYDEEQLEYYQAKIKEIDEVDLHEGDIESLEAEKKKMSQFEKINQKLAAVLNLIQSDHGALDSLYQADHSFNQINDEGLEDLQSQLSNVYFNLRDISDQIESYKDDLVFDEYRYEEITNKLFLIRKLQRAYGYDEIDIINKKIEFEEKIALIENRDVLLQKQEKLYIKCKNKALSKANEISSLRQARAKDLENEIISELKALYMENTVFACDFEIREQLMPSGIDNVTFLISTNVGMKLQKLSEVASGGELSRLMLGMKCIFTRIQHVSTIIFDEVDTGVSGKVAFAIGKKMKQISKNTQVICITHLPQVASFAHHHLYVSKSIENEMTTTKANWLTLDERICEVAKMLSNDTINDTAYDNAKYLIEENSKL